MSLKTDSGRQIVWQPHNSSMGEPRGFIEAVVDAVTACRRSHSGTALDIMRPGAGARDPGMVSTNAYPWPPAPSLSGWALRPGEVLARDTRNTAWHHVAWRWGQWSWR